MFLLNDSRQAWQGEVSLAASGPGEQWDPATGAMTAVSSPQAIPVRLDPFAGIFFRFKGAAQAERTKPTAGPLPGLAFEALPAVRPSLGKGEFVEGEANACPSLSSSGLNAWKSNGRLTKGGVDAFSFLLFQYPQPLDLSQAACLVVERKAPEGQTSPAAFFAILRDSRGVEYLANADHPTNEPGFMRFILPWSEFQRAGWSQAQEADLDRSSIVAISLGWGGYIGSEGDTIEFAVSDPQIGRIQRP
jgi:hypothetical protein